MITDKEIKSKPLTYETLKRFADSRGIKIEESKNNMDGSLHVGISIRRYIYHWFIVNFDNELIYRNTYSQRTGKVRKLKYSELIKIQNILKSI